MDVPPQLIRLGSLLSEERLRLKLQPPAEGPGDESPNEKPDAEVEGGSIGVTGLVQVAQRDPALYAILEPLSACGHRRTHHHHSYDADRRYSHLVTSFVLYACSYQLSALSVSQVLDQKRRVGRNAGGFRCFVACSYAYASAMSLGSLQAVPMNDRPTGRP